MKAKVLSLLMLARLDDDVFVCEDSIHRQGGKKNKSLVTLRANASQSTKAFEETKPSGKKNAMVPEGRREGRAGRRRLPVNRPSDALQGVPTIRQLI